MKYILTGSIGNISKPLAQQLVAAGHDVTIISSNADRQSDIENLGATAAIGSVLDAEFLANVFTGADAVYLMVPPNFTVTDWPAYQREVADAFLRAVKTSGINNIVQLSSIGAHVGHSAGPIDEVGNLERKLEAIGGLNVVALRPSYFYTNLYTTIDMIKHAGIIGSNMGDSSAEIILTHPADIADVAAKVLLDLDFKGQNVKYISSDIRTFAEVAAVIGNAIGKPDLPWVNFTDEQAFEGAKQAGLHETFAEGFTQMGKSFREGLLQTDYLERNEKPQGKVKLEDFAKEFALAFQAN
ncbi:NAD(P)H-binding protein [Flavobacterium sp.]|uniref:NAD(P)H-binding protein n=1 Tax=Flavobacterium sp. TaxID=239 RepID=UPI0026156F20|nr:NAD(P)H-binding protein [Flavobacterium sp.]